jgi:hypothetical protein
MQSIAGSPNSSDIPPTLAVSGSGDTKKDSLTSAVSESLSRGDWIRTSDLLNPIQGVWRGNLSENASLSRLRAF